MYKMITLFFLTEIRSKICSEHFKSKNVPAHFFL